MLKTMLAKLIVPESNETREIDVAQTWEVRWYSAEVDLRYSSLTKFNPAMEVFLSSEEAEAFAQSLRNAYALARVTGLSVKVSKREPLR